MLGSVVSTGEEPEDLLSDLINDADVCGYFFKNSVQCILPEHISHCVQVHYKELVMMPINSFVASRSGHNVMEWLGREG